MLPVSYIAFVYSVHSAVLEHSVYCVGGEEGLGPRLSKITHAGPGHSAASRKTRWRALL